MRRDFEKLFANLKAEEAPLGLLDRVFMAIDREKELKKKRKTVFCFFSLLAASLVSVPFSAWFLLDRLKTSGIHYFISAAIGDSGIFLALWQDFCLAILESLPVVPIIVFAASMAILIFTLRFFIRRKLIFSKYLFLNYSRH